MELVENYSDGYLTDLEYSQYVNIWEDLLFTNDADWTFTETEWAQIEIDYENESYLIEKIISGLCNHDSLIAIILNNLVNLVSTVALISALKYMLNGEFIFHFVTIPMVLVCLFVTYIYSRSTFVMWERVNTARSLRKRHSQIGKLILDIKEQLNRGVERS